MLVPEAFQGYHDQGYPGITVKGYPKPDQGYPDREYSDWEYPDRGYPDRA